MSPGFRELASDILSETLPQFYMKYKFITAIHYLQLESENQSVELKSGYISNRSSLLSEIFYNKLSLNTLGLHSIDEIREAPSYYTVDGDFGNDVNQNDIDQLGTAFCFAMLRQIQLFVSKLWMLKDNSVYVRDGFLYSYCKSIEDGCTFKASVSLINSFADGNISNIIFTKENLVSVAKDMKIIPLEDILKNRQDFKVATQIQHYKKSGLSRKELAEMYVSLARKESVIPLKILMYSSAMEALVASATTELSHRVGERVAILIGTTPEERCNIYKNVKTGYDIRSKVAHGDFIGKNDETVIRETSILLDSYLRQLLTLDEPYSLKSDEMNKFYLRKLME